MPFLTSEFGEFSTLALYLPFKTCWFSFSDFIFFPGGFKMFGKRTMRKLKYFSRSMGHFQDQLGFQGLLNKDLHFQVLFKPVLTLQTVWIKSGPPLRSQNCSQRQQALSSRQQKLTPSRRSWAVFTYLTVMVCWCFCDWTCQLSNFYFLVDEISL